jgi:hypothetical protein
MIELRYLSIDADSENGNAVQIGTSWDGFPMFAVLQYREGAWDGVIDYETNIIWTEWTDVEISDE